LKQLQLIQTLCIKTARPANAKLLAGKAGGVNRMRRALNG
jgi:hypothetical protein